MESDEKVLHIGESENHIKQPHSNVVSEDSQASTISRRTDYRHTMSGDRRAGVGRDVGESGVVFIHDG